MKHPKIIEGDVVFNSRDDYSAVEKIEGHLNCYTADIHNTFPELTVVDGWLDCREADTRGAFPKLTAVGGWLDCCGVNTQTAFPKLTAVGWYLDCREADTRNAFPKLTAVGGWLDCCGVNTKTAFPKLTVVGDWLNCHGADTRGTFPKLTAVGEWLDCHGADTRGTFPKLTAVGWYLDCRGVNTQTVFPELTVVGGALNCYAAGTRNAFPKLTAVGEWLDCREEDIHNNFPELTTTDRKTAQQQVQAAFRKSGFAFFDGILAEILTTRRTADDATVYKLRLIGRSSVSYGIELGGVFSHGDTVKEARSSLLYKVSDRDKSAYTGWSLDRRITVRQAVESYRVITGACESGTRNFVESVHRRKKYYTVQEVIELTEEQYGHKQYRNFFINK